MTGITTQTEQGHCLHHICSFADSSLNEMESKALYRAADVFGVGWLTERLDEHTMKRVVNNDLHEALFIASACKRDVICVGVSKLGLYIADRF